MSEGGLNKLKQPFSEFLPSSFREELVYTGTIELYSGTARPQQTSQDPINNRLNKLPFGPRWPQERTLGRGFWCWWGGVECCFTGIIHRMLPLRRNSSQEKFTRTIDAAHHEGGDAHSRRSVALSALLITRRAERARAQRCVTTSCHPSSATR